MHRRLPVLILTLLLAAGSTRAQTRPNILWLTCEDISPDLGCYGNDYAHTPNLDHLAEEGVRYLHAVGITGVCAVNRSCLVTGMYSSSIGSQAMRSRTRLPDAIKCFPELLRKAGYYCTNNSKTDYNFPVPPEAWDASNNRAHWKNRHADQPFFAVFNYTGTHESQYRLSPKAWSNRIARLKPEELHNPAQAPIPPFHPDTPEVRRDWANYYDTITALDYWIGDQLSALEEAGLADNTIVFFYSDHGAGMPGCKKWIWNRGLQVPLLIRYPTAWQETAPGRAGTTTDRLVSFVDFAPTVLSLAGVEIPATMQGSAFLGPRAGPPREFTYVIRDRMAERYDLVRAVRNQKFQYMRNYLPHLPWSQFVSYTEAMPTMRVWRRLHEQGQLNPVQDRYFQPKPTEELYDLARDPEMVRNLAGNPAHAGELERFREELQAWQLRTRDLGLLPEYEMHLRAAQSTPYDIARDPEALPIAQLQAVAQLASARDPAQCPELVRRLRDPDAAIRWWAATGLTALGTHAAPAEDALHQALDDTSPIVQVAAAEALAGLGHQADMLPHLTRALQHPAPYVRLQAINVLDRMGDSAQPARAAIRASAMPGATPFPADYLNRMAGYVSAGLKPNP